MCNGSYFFIGYKGFTLCNRINSIQSHPTQSHPTNPTPTYTTPVLTLPLPPSHSHILAKIHPTHIYPHRQTVTSHTTSRHSIHSITAHFLRIYNTYHPAHAHTQSSTHVQFTNAHAHLHTSHSLAFIQKHYLHTHTYAHAHVPSFWYHQ